MTRLVLLALAFSLTLPAANDLDALESESNLEKRADKALILARQQLDAATKIYRSGDIRTAMAKVEDVVASVDYAVKSLADSGKDPRRSKYYKRAEQRTRELARRMTDFADSADYQDRPLIQRARDHILAVHDHLLDQILLRKKK